MCVWKNNCSNSTTVSAVSQLCWSSVLWIIPSLCKTHGKTLYYVNGWNLSADDGLISTTRKTGGSHEGGRSLLAENPKGINFKHGRSDQTFGMLYAWKQETRFSWNGKKTTHISTTAVERKDLLTLLCFVVTSIFSSLFHISKVL